MNIASAFDRLRQTPPEQFLQQASRVLPAPIALMLTLIVAWNLGRIAWMLVPSPLDGTVVVPPPPAAATAAAAAPDEDRTDDVRSIVAAHLFGEFNPAEEQAAAAAAAMAEAPPEEELQEERSLKLLGVLADTRGLTGQAVIVNSRGEAAVYGLDEQIEGEQARLDAVYATWVRLNKNGQFTRLSLPDLGDLPGVDQSPSRRRSSQIRSAPNRNVRRAIQRRAPSSDGDGDGGGGGGGGAPSLSDLVRPQPVFENGRLNGYRLYPGRNRQAFSRLGLRPGDKVTQVNGTPLNDASQAMRMLRQFEGQTPIAVTLERDGGMTTLVLDPAQMSLDALDR